MEALQTLKKNRKKVRLQEKTQKPNNPPQPPIQLCWPYLYIDMVDTMIKDPQMGMIGDADIQSLLPSLYDKGPTSVPVHAGASFFSHLGLE